MDELEFQLGMRRLQRILGRHSTMIDSDVVVDSKIEIHECKLCGHVWTTRPDRVPSICPACRTSLWNRDGITTKRCYRCGHTWHSSLDNPARCPSCKSKVWYKEELRITCKRCGSKWQSPLKDGMEVICPQCGKLDAKGYSVSARTFERKTDVQKEVHDGLNTQVIRKMRTIDGDIFRTMYLREHGLTPLQADIIVLYDKGIPVSTISAEMGVAVADIIPVVNQYRRLVETMGEIA